VSKKRGRPPADSRDLPMTKRRRQNACVPCDVIRYDAVGHWTKWTDHKERCKNDGCKGIGRVTCEKCKVHLCFYAKQDCFSSFHLK
jgi:hypothetical protein